VEQTIVFRRLPTSQASPNRNTSIQKWENEYEVTRYSVVIHKEPEGGYWAEVPALPGCYSQGETVESLMENVREAISGVLDVMRDEGREPDSDIQILEVAV